MSQCRPDNERLRLPTIIGHFETHVRVLCMYVRLKEYQIIGEKEASTNNTLFVNRSTGAHEKTYAKYQGLPVKERFSTFVRKT